MFSCAVSRSRRSRRLRRSRRGGTGRAVRNSESICALISSIFCLRYASGPPGPAVDGRRVCNISATPGRPKTVGSSAPNTSSSSKSRSAPSAPPDANSGSSRDPPVDISSSKPRETSSRSKSSFSSRKFPDASRSVSLAEASRSISVSWSTGSPTGSPSSFTSLHCTNALSSPPAETSHLLSPASGENRTHATLFECASSCSFAGAPGATHG